MKSLIVANWKCHPSSLAEAKEIFGSVERGITDIKNAEVVICPPFVYLSALGANGAQDVFYEEKGAYTGEISPLMLKDMGVEYVIVGHSERRKHQQETDEVINKKLKAAALAGLKPILCIDKISQIPQDIQENLILAYEPLFAIGTGKACSPDEAEKMRISIKEEANFPVLYGGSVNSENARDYTQNAHFDGLLVGGASLKSDEFIKIIKAVDF